MRDTGMQLLDDAMATAAGVEADTVLFDQSGERLAEAVAKAARQWKADLVVVGTHGRRGVSAVLEPGGHDHAVLKCARLPASA